jgi:hypothetical protein
MELQHEHYRDTESDPYMEFVTGKLKQRNYLIEI